MKPGRVRCAEGSMDGPPRNAEEVSCPDPEWEHSGQKALCSVSQTWSRRIHAECGGIWRQVLGVRLWSVIMTWLPTTGGSCHQHDMISGGFWRPPDFSQSQPNNWEPPRLCSVRETKKSNKYSFYKFTLQIHSYYWHSPHDLKDNFHLKWKSCHHLLKFILFLSDDIHKLEM